MAVAYIKEPTDGINRLLFCCFLINIC